MMERIVFLDAQTLPVAIPRLPWAHEWENYPLTMPQDVIQHAQAASVIITNKVALPAVVLKQLPALKMIAVAATGYNHVDTAYCRAQGIAVANVQGYARVSVTEHVLLSLLALRRQLLAYHHAIQQGAWQKSSQFALLDYPIIDLAGSTLGIVGAGDLGQAVAAMAQALGMQVLLAEHRGAAQLRPGRVAFEEVLACSDAVSIHCPLTPVTRHLIDATALAQMKPSAVLINTARGGVVDEMALVAALRSGRLAGAAVDVLSQEPPVQGNPLLASSVPNLLVTPHIAWASQGALTELAQALHDNIAAFFAGDSRNRVV